MPVTYLSTEPACCRGIRVTCPPFPPLRCDLVLALPSEPAACLDSLCPVALRGSLILSSRVGVGVAPGGFA